MAGDVVVVLIRKDPVYRAWSRFLGPLGPSGRGAGENWEVGSGMSRPKLRPLWTKSVQRGCRPWLAKGGWGQV